ncbi:MAG TPA: hypothetical protein VI318_19500 [Baekduia sp.]
MIPVLADAATTAPIVAYAGQTAENRRIVVRVRGRTVVGVSTRVVAYPCATFGDVGPVVVSERMDARIGRDGRFRFTTGEVAQRLTVAGVLRTRTREIAGTVRLHGSIATGQKCASATLRYRASAQDR